MTSPNTSTMVSVRQGGWHGKTPLTATAGNGSLVTTTESGENITIIAGGTSGNDDDFSYSFTDANGKTSSTKTVTIDVTGASVAFTVPLAPDAPSGTTIFVSSGVGPGAALPDWAVAQQAAMFRHVLAPLRALRPQAAEQDLVLLSRTLFAAVHGVVALGLDEKLVAVSRQELEAQVETLVRLVATGLAGR